MAEYEPESLEESRAPLIEHITELRNRLILSVVAFAAAFVVAFVFAEEIYRFLVVPLADAFPNPEAKRMIYTGLAEAFLTYMKLGLFGGLFLAFPFIAFQLYRFMAPGLYKRERHVVLPFLIAAPMLFVGGAALAYYGVFPLAWQFFLSFETAGGQGALPIELEAKVGEYLGLTMHILIAFGFAFQLPVILTLLARAGFVKSESLKKGRKYAVVGVVTAAAILTPPDVFSQIGLSIPLYLLYECSIFSCRWVERQASEPKDEEANHA